MLSHRSSLLESSVRSCYYTCVHLKRVWLSLFIIVFLDTWALLNQLKPKVSPIMIASEMQTWKQPISRHCILYEYQPGRNGVDMQFWIGPAGDCF